MEPSPSDPIPRIPGIDSEDLLERIGEDLELFWDVLGEFASSYRDSPAQIVEALERDPALAKQLAHTLKGVLGNLGATSLFATCKALDDAIGAGYSELYPELLDTLSRDVPALCDAIARARTAAPGAAEPLGPALGPDWLAERYAALRSALGGHRARDCKTLTDEIGASSLPPIEQAFFDNLRVLVRSYRFKEAQALLDRHLDA
jgi:HPt (histidine-containing phosphotransfer) domain-containing protein